MIAAMDRLLSLFRKPQPPKVPASVPVATRVYAIGDIHGRADLLERMEALIASDAAGAPDRRVIVFLGDYIDRGLESAQVIDRLIDRLIDPLAGSGAGFEHVFLCGNHEDAMLGFLDDAAKGPLWLANGGDAALYSYGVRIKTLLPYAERLAAVQAELRAKVPPAHLDFLRGLKRLHIEGDYLFVHAGVRPGVAIDAQSAEDLIWIREPFLSTRADFGKVVVHGHTINANHEAPEICANRIGIDTGAYATGKLTCLVLEGETRRFLQT